ncbi:MAG: LuxR C-terminal-related transcriptional regulator, partial [Streptosporangiaceae bacterium]
DKLIGVLACLVAARGSLAQRHAGSALELVARALRGWSPPPWLERDLTLAEAQAHRLEENVPAAVDAARRAGAGTSVDAAAALAGACLAAGDIEAARLALTRVAAAAELAPDHVCLPVWLADAHLAQETGDQARSQGLLERAVRLAESEQLRLPFVIERAWMQGALQRNPDLALAFRHLMQPPAMIRGASTRSRTITRSGTIPPGKPASTPPRQVTAAQSTPLIVEKLSEREREVLEHASQMLGTAEIAAEMFVSVNTVKSHLKSIFRKLGAASRNEAVRRARQLQLI